VSVLEAEMFEADAPRESWTDWLARWPVVSCLFVTAMFMLATNDPEAVSKWQEVTREKSTQLSLVLESGRPMRQVAFILLGLWGLSSLLRPSRRLRATSVILFPVLVFVAWSFVSLLWSTDRAFTVKRLVVFACVVSGVMGFVRRLRPRDLVLLALVGCTVQIAFDVVADMLWATGNYGKSGYRLSGLQHPNHVGIACVFAILASLVFYDRTRLRRFLMLAAAVFVVLFLTKSRSSLIAGIGAIGVYSLLRWPLRNVLAAAFALGIAITGFAVLDQTGIIPEDWSNVIHMGRDDASSSALTGRPLVWSAAMELFGFDPIRYLTGYGYDSFWTPERAIFVSNRLWYHISEGHNSYFDLLLALGVVGSACYSFALLGSLIRWSQLASRHNSANYAFCAAILMFAVVHGLTESTMVAPNFPTFFSFSAIAYLAFRAPRPFPAQGDDR
jgi:hypothetical protein